MTSLAKTLVLDLPHKPDADLGGNSRAHWRTVRTKFKADKETAWAFTLEALVKAGTSASEFLTHDGAYPLEAALPVQLLFRRYYSGSGREWDQDNLILAYKGFRDGIAFCLDINDRRMTSQVEQVRQSGPARLEIIISPAWVGTDNLPQRNLKESFS